MDINPNLTLDEVVAQKKEAEKLARQQQQSRGGGGRGRGGRNFENNNNDDGNEDTGVVIDRSVRVFIKNIPTTLIERFDDKALLEELNSCTDGAVVRYTLLSDRSGRYNGSAMATFKNAHAANTAIKELHGKQMGPSDPPLELEHAREHAVVLQSKVKEQEGIKRLAEQPWQHDRFDANNNNTKFGGRGFGRGRGGRGGGAAGRGGRGGAVQALDLDAQLDSFLS